MDSHSPRTTRSTWRRGHRHSHYAALLGWACLNSQTLTITAINMGL